MRSTLVIAALAVASSACYQYFPVEDVSPLPEPGTEVRARLNPPLPLELGSVTVHDVSTVEGDVYRSNGDTLGVFSRLISSAYGFRQFTNGAVFYFDRSQLGRLERRKLVPVQTGVAIGAATAGVVALMYFVLDLGGGGSGGGGPPGDGQTRRAAAIPVGLLIPH